MWNAIPNADLDHIDLIYEGEDVFFWNFYYVSVANHVSIVETPFLCGIFATSKNGYVEKNEDPNH